MRDDERQMGVPPHWNLYVTVASVDESARRAQELGGTLLVPPFDVMDAGRMSVVQDPTGAIIHLWEAKRSIGAKILGEAGALCWSELTTRDPNGARAFYTALFGWTARESGAGSPMPYTEFSNQGQPGMGMMKMPDHMPAEVPSYWMPYFQVANCDQATAKAAGLGATIMVPAQDISQTGRFSILSDPQGAVFAVFTFVS
jgi:predicted enzyme related to lactoylglutathione lyase